MKFHLGLLFSQVCSIASTYKYAYIVIVSGTTRGFQIPRSRNTWKGVFCKSKSLDIFILYIVLLITTKSFATLL